MGWQWQTPAWQTPVDRADRVELLSLPREDIVPAEGWPEEFWGHVGKRHLVSGAEGQRVIRLFRQLEPGESARCHMPRSGLALYERETLLFTVTLCYRCSNAYVYTGGGRDLRAFNPEGSNAADLRQLLNQHLKLLQ